MKYDYSKSLFQNVQNIYKILTKVKLEQDELVNNKEEVRIKNFGTFKFGKSAGRTTKHPVTKKTIVIEIFN